MYHFKRTEIGNNTCVQNLNRTSVDYIYKQGGITKDPHYQAYPHAWALPLEYGPDFYPDIRRAENGMAFTASQGRVIRDITNDIHNRNNVIYNGDLGMYNYMRDIPSPSMGHGPFFTESYFNNGPNA